MNFSQGTGRVAKGGPGSGRHANYANDYAENLTTWDAARHASGEDPSVPSVLADHSAVVLENARDNIGLEDQPFSEIRAAALDMAAEHTNLQMAHAIEAANSFVPSRNFDYTGEMFQTDAGKAHAAAVEAHRAAADAWNKVSRLANPSGGEMLAAFEASAAAADASRIARYVSEHPEGNTFPYYVEDSMVTKGGPGSGRTATVTRMTDVAEEDLTPAERKEFFRTGSPEYHTGPRSIYYRGNPTLPDGMVNPRTLEVGTGKNKPYGFSPAEQHIVVQGYRPGGTIFTRVIERQSSDEKIGDVVSFQHDQTGKFLGKGTIIGITDPNTGKAYGTFPDKKLSHHVYK